MAAPVSSSETSLIHFPLPLFLQSIVTFLVIVLIWCMKSSRNAHILGMKSQCKRPCIPILALSRVAILLCRRFRLMRGPALAENMHMWLKGTKRSAKNCSIAKRVHVYSLREQERQQPSIEIYTLAGKCCKVKTLSIAQLHKLKRTQNTQLGNP